MSEIHIKSLSPVNRKKTFKDINKHLSIDSPLIQEHSHFGIPLLTRRKSATVRNSIISKEKTEEEKEKEQRMRTKLFRQSAPGDICIEALKIIPNIRTEQQIKIISYYLQMLKNFMSIFKDQIQNEELDEFLYNISSALIYEHIPKNKFIFKFADRAEKFYIILKGKVDFCVPKVNKILMNENEYILFLIKLRFNEEIELLKKNLESNKISFNYGDNFDQFVLKKLDKHEKDKENVYSEEIYLCFKKIKELFIEKKYKEENRNNTDEITVQKYLQRTSLTSDIISNNNNIISEKKKFLLNIYQYEKTNTFEDGDCFGLSSSKKKSKNHKRSATAISKENCDLAVLDKILYDQTLDKITKKAKERLYKLVMSHKLFIQISKHTFINKYYHMFRFCRFYLNNEIMDENEKFDKIIIFTSGEFILSVNKNIFELNDLIVKIKKIRGNFYNFTEKQIKNDLNEIKENENFENTKKYASHSINEYIHKRQNLIISTINDKMILGYPDTVCVEDALPYFNCKCISTSATAYVVEKEMIKLFERDGYLRTTPPKIAVQKIDFYLRRLLEHKKNIMNRIEFLEEQDKKIGYNNINENKYEKNNYNKQNKDKLDNNDINKYIIDKKDDINLKQNEEQNDDLLLNITRNNLNPINIKNNNFEFQSKKILDPSYLSLESNHLNKNRNNTLIPSISNNKEEIFKISMNKYKKQIKKKTYLLKISQQKSPRFILKEKLAEKKFQMNMNKFNIKEIYNNISNIFSKEPNKKKSLSVLNKYQKTEDIVLDSKIDSLKKQINYEKLNLFLPSTNKPSEISTIINTRNNTDTSLNIRDKYILTSNKNETINDSTKINHNIKSRNKIQIKQLPKKYNMINNSEIKNIKIKYNNLSLDADKIDNDDNNINKLNKTKFKNLYNELYTDYIYAQLNNNENNKIKQNQSVNKNNNIYKKVSNYKLNKIQLNKIKYKFSSDENNNNIQKKDKKEISLIDPFELGNFADKYNKERLDNK